MGRQNQNHPNKIVKLAGPLVIAVAMLLGTAVPVCAVDAPTSLSIEGVKVVRHVIEDDDFALAVHYNIDYGTLPNESAADLFHFNAFDIMGDNIGSVEPYGYNDKGYGEGIVLFYWAAANAPTWQSALNIKVTGNPAAAWSGAVPETTRTLLVSDYSSSTTQEGNQTVLYNFMINSVKSIEVAWGLSLIDYDVRSVLNSVGETYVRGSIPGIHVMAPDLFAIKENTPNYTKRTWTTTLFDFYKNRWAGTAVGTALNGMGRLTGDADNWQWATGILTVLLIIGFFFLSHKWFSETRPAIAAGINMLVGGAVMGFVSPLLIALPTVLAGLFIGYALIFRNSS